ncbi:hypothetical protein J3Q64DRAFT_1858417 [Phycomyces blakesleeanus]
MCDLYSEFDPAKYSCVVGIDFGTTYSGCSCVYVNDGVDEIFDITAWPRPGGSSYAKVPTACLYAHDSKKLIAWGHDAIRKANDVNNKDILVERFKLLLDSRIPASVKLPHGLKPLDVIADYLTEFNKYIHDCFKRKFGVIYNKEKFRYCLTVPAMWDDYAKSLMREAAIRADIVTRLDNPNRLVLTSEPEAAALYCEKKSEQFKLTDGQRFLVCDAGGGTVDLIVFEVTRTAGKKTIKEVTQGHGSSCGSTFLDQNMREVFKSRFGDLAEINKPTIDIMVNQFITSAKPGFENKDNEHFIVPAKIEMEGREMEEIGIVNGSLCVTVKEMREKVFDPIVKEITELILRQLNQTGGKIDAMFLVGGLGQSIFLYQCLTETFADRINLIAVPQRGELAIVRGAVILGMNPEMITHRVSRRTYGRIMADIFDASKHPAENKYIDPAGYPRCSSCFKVFIYKGDTIRTDEYIESNFSYFYPGIPCLDLYVFDGDGDPPMLVTDPGSRLVTRCTMEKPVVPGAKAGDEVNICSRVYLGLTEICMENTILDKTYTFTSSFKDHELKSTPKSIRASVTHSTAFSTHSTLPSLSRNRR